MDAAVASGMLEAAKQVGIEGRIFITHPSIKGAHVISADPPFSEGEGNLTKKGAMKSTGSHRRAFLLMLSSNIET